MEQISGEVRNLVYVVICFQCLLQITEGSSYQKYLKFFSYMLTLCICCRILLSFSGEVTQDWLQADKICEAWQKDWKEGQILDEQEFDSYSKRLEKQIINKAQEEYDRREKEVQNVGESEEISGGTQKGQ